MKSRLSALFIFSLFIYGCSTDFDVTAPYKEVMIIDGLINANDTVQYVRVSKAFLGEGNAMVMAQQKDSTVYADILDVKMDRILNSSVVETFSLSRSESYDKDSGIFYYPYHVLYKTSPANIIHTDGSQYRIRVTNRVSGKTASSVTDIVNSIAIYPAIPGGDSVDLASHYTSPVIVNVTIGSESKAKIFDMIIRFNYREIDPSGNSSFHSVDWNFTDLNFSDQAPSGVRFSFYKNDFFAVIGNGIPDKGGYIRRVDSLQTGIEPIEFRIIAGTEDLQTYLQIQQPTTGVVQERPLFTTVQDGLGLFTSRYIVIDSRYPNDITQQEFLTNPNTSSKNFHFN